MLKSLPQWHAYDWSSGVHRAVEPALFACRTKIAELLQVDLNATEARRVIGAPATPTGRSFDAYIALRNAPGRVEHVASIDIVLDDLKGILCRFIAAVWNVNRRAKYAGVYRALVDISKRADVSEAEIAALDLKVQRRLKADYLDGGENFTPGKLNPILVIETAKHLVRVLPKPPRGRPRASINKAARNLVAELVAVISGTSPDRPSRSVVNKKLNAEILSRSEGGKTLRFLECVIEALPEQYRNEITKTHSGLASLLRRTLER